MSKTISTAPSIESSSRSNIHDVSLSEVDDSLMGDFDRNPDPNCGSGIETFFRAKTTTATAQPQPAANPAAAIQRQPSGVETFLRRKTQPGPPEQSQTGVVERSESLRDATHAALSAIDQIAKEAGVPAPPEPPLSSDPKAVLSRAAAWTKPLPPANLYSESTAPSSDTQGLPPPSSACSAHPHYRFVSMAFQLAWQWVARVLWCGSGVVVVGACV